jgi:hypothetical protein
MGRYGDGLLIRLGITLTAVRRWRFGRLRETYHVDQWWTCTDWKKEIVESNLESRASVAKTIGELRGRERTNLSRNKNELSFDGLLRLNGDAVRLTVLAAALFIAYDREGE